MTNRKNKSQGISPHVVIQKHQYKEGLCCDGCQCKLFRSTIGMAGIQHVHDSFSDYTTGEFKILCAECFQDADGVVRIKDLFPDKLLLQIGRITHYLARDTIGLLQFFRMLERITYSLGLQQERLFLPEDN